LYLFVLFFFFSPQDHEGYASCNDLDLVGALAATSPSGQSYISIIPTHQTGSDAARQQELAAAGYLTAI
jgi:hypothetical protein